MNISQHVFFDLGVKDPSVYYAMAGSPTQNPGVLMDKVGTDMSGYIDSVNISMYFFPSYRVGTSYYSQRRLYSRNVATVDGLGQGAYLTPDAGINKPSFYDVSLSNPNLTHLFTLVSPDYGYYPRCIFWYEEPVVSLGQLSLGNTLSPDVIVDEEEAI